MFVNQQTSGQQICLLYIKIIKGMFSLQETLAEGGRGSSSIFIYIHCKHSDFDVRILKFRN